MSTSFLKSAWKYRLGLYGLFLMLLSLIHTPGPKLLCTMVVDVPCLIGTEDSACVQANHVKCTQGQCECNFY